MSGIILKTSQRDDFQMDWRNQNYPKKIGTGLDRVFTLTLLCVQISVVSSRAKASKMDAESLFAWLVRVSSDFIAL